MEPGSQLADPEGSSKHWVWLSRARHLRRGDVNPGQAASIIGA